MESLMKLLKTIKDYRHVTIKKILQVMRNLISHLTLKVSHKEGTSLSTVTFMPPPLSADTYF